MEKNLWRDEFPQIAGNRRLILTARLPASNRFP